MEPPRQPRQETSNKPDQYKTPHRPTAGGIVSSSIMLPQVRLHRGKTYLNILKRLFQIVRRGKTHDEIHRICPRLDR